MELLDRVAPRAVSPIDAISRGDAGVRATEAAWDAVVYALSAIVAMAISATADAPLDRLWGRVAVFGYAVGGLGGWLLFRREASIRTRAILAAAVFAAVAVVPTIVHAEVRLSSTEVHVKSDVLVVEQAAESFVHGRNPYAAVLDEGALARWPEATKAHFPYLPAILVVGAPRALSGSATWSDARLIYLALALAVAVPSIIRAAAPAEWRLRAFQVLFVLVTAAPLVFTSGKEVLVLALVLASLVALQRGRPGVSGASVGVAAAMHQLAWVPLIVAIATRTASPARRAAAIGVSIASASVVSFVAWDAGAFVEDAVLMPLGFAQPNGTGGIPMPGSLIANLVPQARWMLVIVMAVALGIGLVAIARRGLSSSADVALGAGILLLGALLLAPRVRLAYVAFPVNLLLWSRMLRGPGASGDQHAPGIIPTMALVRKPKIDKSGRTSAGILLWRMREDRLEVLLGHPGGPYFAGKDADHWTVLKGEVDPGEDLQAVAGREFAEETGHRPPEGPMIELGEIRQKSGKRVLAWAIEGDLDTETAVSNTFEMEWPPRSGRIREFPEINRVALFDLGEARVKIKAAQAPFLDRLERAGDP
jgi:predicted NUDIX family NTP pyrophosphohydrolase